MEYFLIFLIPFEALSLRKRHATPNENHKCYIYSLYDHSGTIPFLSSFFSKSWTINQFYWVMYDPLLNHCSKVHSRSWLCSNEDPNWYLFLLVKYMFQFYGSCICIADILKSNPSQHTPLGLFYQRSFNRIFDFDFRIPFEFSFRLRQVLPKTSYWPSDLETASITL